MLPGLIPLLMSAEFEVAQSMRTHQRQLIQADPSRFCLKNDGVKTSGINLSRDFETSAWRSIEWQMIMMFVNDTFHRAASCLLASICENVKQGACCGQGPLGLKDSKL